MSLQIYILGKLMEESSYPYKLKKSLSEPLPISEMANLTESKLYYHFESLLKKGLIEEKEIIQEENRPDKHVFAITEKGRLELPKMIYKMFEKAQSPTDMLVGISTLQYVEVTRVISILEKKIAQIEQKQHMHQVMYKQLDTIPYLEPFSDYFGETTVAYIHMLKKLIAELQKH